MTMIRPLFRSFPRSFVAAGLAVASCVPLAGQAAAAAPTPSPSPSATPELKITLKWTTASEVDNYGYNVYRGDAEDGPWTKLNEKIIPGAGNTDTPTDYQWVDRVVEWGRTYYYRLESVSVQGATDEFSGIVSRKCCGPSPSPEATPAAAPSPEPQAR